MPSSLAVVVNPISGVGGRADRGEKLLKSVSALLEMRGVDPVVRVTEGVGHAREVAREMVEQGVSTIVAWGGDGTVNEVASALAFGDTRLAIVPVGSGNGLARCLRIPLDPGRALDVALNGHDKRIDVGELDRRRFVNAAGVGLDAAIAHRFATDGLDRGLRRYAQLTVSEVFGYHACTFTVIADGQSMQATPLLMTIANGTEFGNGAVIAADALTDDGKLDLVVARQRTPLVALLQAPMLFLGGATKLPGVVWRQVTNVSIQSAGPIRYHVDGEPGIGGTTINAQVHSRALTVKVPGAV